MRILLTGHRGFIGQSLSRALSNHNLSFFDWGDPFPKLQELDWVIHVGAISSTSESNVSKIIEQNLVFSIELFEKCIKYNVNFQWASSASIYGPTQHFKEDGPVSPQSHYARYKYLLEQYILTRQAPIIYQGFRYFNVYGPGEEHKSDPSPYTLFKRQALTKGHIEIFKGSEYIYRDFVPVERVCQIHLDMLQMHENGVWNIGTSKPRSFYEIAKIISSQYNVPIKYIPMPEKLKTQYQYYTCANMEKLKQTYEKNFCKWQF